MNYYNEIKSILVDNAIGKKVREYKSNQKDLESYYNVGKLLVEAQGGEEKAKYGNELMKEYSKKLTNELGKGYSVRMLQKMRQFYLLTQKSPPMAAKFKSINITWSNICEIMQLKNLEEIEKNCLDLDGMLEGTVSFGQASTIVDCTSNEIKILRKGPISEDEIIKALNKTDFEIEKGELVVIVGPSGAGKTTTLNILGGMDKATSGEVIVDGKEITKLNDKKLIEYRRNDIGFVFQFYNLVQNLTAKENVELATQICSDALDVNEILEKVGLSDRKDNFPAQLSGGEQQRVAIARAIAKNPKLLLCDEPTGALDYKTGKSILKLLQEMARKEKMTVAIITHNGAIAPMADKVIHFKNGTAEKIEINDNPISIDEIEW